MGAYKYLNNFVVNLA